MKSAYPNPFNPTVNFNFSIPEQNHVKVIIYDIRGRVVTELLNEIKNPGIYKTSWIADNYASGIYFIEINSGTFKDVRKVTLLK